MGDEANGGYVALGVGLEGGIEIALVVEFDVAEAFVFEFFLEVFGEEELLGGAGHGLAVFGRLGVELDIVEESLCNIHR